MKGKKPLRVVGSALAVAVSFAISADAQDVGFKAQDEPASSSTTEQTEQWATGVYDSAKTAASDTLITLKIKVALLKEKTVGENDIIHVSTNNGVVTLAGNVHSSIAMTHAEEVARSARGVRDVANKLGLTPTAPTAATD